MKKRILIAEDDVNFGNVLRDYLELNDFSVTLTRDGQELLDAYRPGYYDLCILDVMMPKRDGFSAAREIRKLSKLQPLIFLTAKSMKQDMVEGFEIGADDYLVKPFDPEVLILKIKAILNRGGGLPDLTERELKIGTFTYNTELRELKRDGAKPRKLSPKEGELLELLVLYKNRLMPRTFALEKIWGEDNYFTGRSMDVYVAKLRKYLHEDPDVEIMNIHSEGFRLIENTSRED